MISYKSPGSYKTDPELKDLDIIIINMATFTYIDRNAMHELFNRMASENPGLKHYCEKIQRVRMKRLLMILKVFQVLSMFIDKNN
jgi:hypothetical protein